MNEGFPAEGEEPTGPWKDQTMSRLDLWNRYRSLYCAIPSLGFSLDVSRIDFPDEFLVSANKHRPEYLASITSPPPAPNE